MDPRRHKEPKKKSSSRRRNLLQQDEFAPLESFSNDPYPGVEPPSLEYVPQYQQTHEYSQPAEEQYQNVYEVSPSHLESQEGAIPPLYPCQTQYPGPSTSYQVSYGSDVNPSSSKEKSKSKKKSRKASQQGVDYASGEGGLYEPTEIPLHEHGYEEMGQLTHDMIEVVTEEGHMNLPLATSVLAKYAKTQKKTNKKGKRHDQ